jgi:hypothetical protein
MHKIKLVYNREPSTQTLKESITYCASLELYTVHGIECYQTSASELLFECERTAMLAYFYLSASTSFVPKFV